MDDFHRIDHVPACATNFPVGHGGTYSQPHGGEFSVVAIAWLNWQLKGQVGDSALFMNDEYGKMVHPDWTFDRKNW